MVEYEYAKAIFELAVEEKKTELFLDYFNGLLDVLSTSKDFYKFLASPLVDTKEKIRGIQKVFNRLDSTFIQFLCVLVQANRFDLVEAIEEEYKKLLSDFNSILKIEVISSEKLAKKRQEEISRSLAKRYPDKKLFIEDSVNPKILSGLQIICNGQSLDLSLKNRLTKLKNSL